MKKLIISLWVFSLITAAFSVQTVFAQDAANNQQGLSGIELGTLIPKGADKDCNQTLTDVEKDPKIFTKEFNASARSYVLSCAISTGRIHMWMIPYYVVYLIQFLIGIAGLLAVMFLVIGGFQYVASGLSTSKDKAKGTIQHALLGLGIALAAWAVVNLVQYLITM